MAMADKSTPSDGRLSAYLLAHRLPEHSQLCAL